MRLAPNQTSMWSVTELWRGLCTISKLTGLRDRMKKQHVMRMFEKSQQEKIENQADEPGRKQLPSVSLVVNRRIFKMHPLYNYYMPGISGCSGYKSELALTFLIPAFPV